MTIVYCYSVYTRAYVGGEYVRKKHTNKEDYISLFVFILFIEIVGMKLGRKWTKINIDMEQTLFNKTKEKAK